LSGEEGGEEGYEFFEGGRRCEFSKGREGYELLEGGRGVQIFKGGRKGHEFSKGKRMGVNF
jgi:hypothetical protein